MVISHSQSLDAVFHALADATRRSIVEQLAQGDLPVMALARQFAISQPAVTKHLNVLEDAGLISRHADGRTRTCRLHPDVLDASRRWIEDMRTYWNERLDALEEFLAVKQRPEAGHARRQRPPH